MSRRHWRGYAYFELPDSCQKALITVCPGNSDHEGRRFRAILEGAGAKLDYLYVINAADLGYHNLKRLLPEDNAKTFARYRGQLWQESHQSAIDIYMRDRCHVIPMREITADPSYALRLRRIQEIYEAGDNAVTKWFDHSADLDILSRSSRMMKNGVTVEPWALRQNSIDYLCEEYAMRSLMWQKFRLPEIYLGLSVTQSDLFQQHNTDPSVDLTIPEVYPITLNTVKMVHVEKLGNAIPAEEQEIPPYAQDMGCSLRITENPFPAVQERGCSGVNKK